MRDQIVKNLLSNYVGTFLGMALGFLIIPFLVFKLGKEAYGLTVLAEAIINLLQMLVYSARIGLARTATVELSRQNEEGFVASLIAGRKMLWLATWALLIPGAVISWFFPIWFNVPPEHALGSRWLCFLILGGFVLSIPNALYWSVLYARQRFDLINVSVFGGVILRAVMIFVLFSFIPVDRIGLPLYGLIYFAMVVGTNHLVRVWAAPWMPELKGRVVNVKSKLKEILSFSGYTVVGNVNSVLFENSMNVIINIFMGPAANAVYSIANKIPEIIKRLFLAPSHALTPTFTDLYARNDSARLQRLLIMYSKMIHLVVTPILIVLMFSSRQIIELWVGPDFQEAGAVMPIFLLATFFYVAVVVSSIVVTSFGAVKVPTIVGTTIVFASIGLAVWLGFGLNRGLQGIALAVLAGNICRFVFYFFYTSRLLRISPLRYAGEVILAPLLIALVMFGAFFLFQQSVFGQVTGRSVFVSLLGVLLVQYALSFRFVLSPFERSQSISILRAGLGKFLKSA